MTKAELQKARHNLKSETDVQKAIRQYLLSTRRPYSITDATLSLNVRGQRVQRVRLGWPDITTVTKDGRLFVIEVKKPVGGVLSRDQALMLRRIHEWGGLICIARSVTDVQETEASGTAQADDLAEIARAIAKPVKSGLEGKPVNELGF